VVDRTLVMTAGMQGAARVCHDLARRFLGEFDEQARWRVPPRQYTKVAVPNRAAWNAGRRWYVCEVIPRSGEYPFLFTGTAAGARSAAARRPCSGPVPITSMVSSSTARSRTGSSS
jgi:hypothetical protein